MSQSKDNTSNMGASTSSQDESAQLNDILEDQVQKKQKNDPNRPKTQLRFITFNVRVDSLLDGKDRWVHRKGAVANILLEQNADIIGIQGAYQNQVDDLSNLLNEKSNNKYSWFGLGQCFNENTSEYSGEYNPIFYNSSKLELVDQGVFWYSLEPADKGSKSWDAIVPTICTWCKFKTTDGGSNEFVVFNTHWDYGVETRRNAAYLLREYIEQFTASYDDDTNEMTQNTSVVLGDLNCTVNSNCYKILTRGIDAAAAGNPEDVDSEEEEEEEEEADDETIQLVNCGQNVRCETTYPGFGLNGETHDDELGSKLCGGPRDVKYGTVVDFVLASPDVSVSSFKVLTDVKCDNGRRPSTHYPIVADLTL